jgi:hypothetical protein
MIHHQNKVIRITIIISIVKLVDFFKVLLLFINRLRINKQKRVMKKSYLLILRSALFRLISNYFVIQFRIGNVFGVKYQNVAALIDLKPVLQFF